MKETTFKTLSNFVGDDVKELTHEEAKTIIDNLKENPKELYDFAKKLAANSQKLEELQKEVVERIREIVEKVKETEKSYRRIYGALISVDKSMKSDWSKKWKSMWDKFIVLINETKQVAAVISLYAKRQAEVLIPFLTNKENTLESKRGLIKQTIERIDQRKKESDELFVRFNSYKTEFFELNEKFKADFEEWLKQQKSEVKKEIEKIEKEIKEIKEELSKVGTAVAGLGIGLGVVLPVTAVFFALGFINPLFWLGAIVSGIGAVAIASSFIYFLKKQRELDEQLNNKNDELDKATQKLKGLEETEESISLLKDDVNRVVDLAHMFSGFWSSISAELTGLMEQIDILDDYVVSKDDYDLTISLWNMLHITLDEYSKANFVSKE